jgi:hypothetical protein
MVFSGWHLPATQSPLQHAALAVHTWLSEMQMLASHLPPVHVTLQQSVALVHVVLAAPQAPSPPVHAWFASQSFEQQSLAPVQAAPRTLQVPALPSPPPSVGTAVELEPPHPWAMATTRNARKLRVIAIDAARMEGLRGLTVQSRGLLEIRGKCLLALAVRRAGAVAQPTAPGKWSDLDRRRIGRHFSTQ